MIFVSFSIEKIVFPCSYVLSSSHLVSFSIEKIVFPYSYVLSSSHLVSFSIEKIVFPCSYVLSSSHLVSFSIEKIVFPCSYLLSSSHLVSFSIEKIVFPCSYVLSSSHLTPCTPTKSDLHLANFLAAGVSEPNLYRLLTFQVPNLMSLFQYFCRTEVSGQFRGVCSCFGTKTVFTMRSCQPLPEPPSWRTTYFPLSATAYSVYLHLPFILEDVPSSAT